MGALEKWDQMAYYNCGNWVYLNTIKIRLLIHPYSDQLIIDLHRFNVMVWNQSLLRLTMHTMVTLLLLLFLFYIITD